MSYAMSLRELDQIEMRARTRLDVVMERVGLQLVAERENTDANSSKRGQSKQAGETDGRVVGGTDGSEPRDQSPSDPSRPAPQLSE